MIGREEKRVRNDAVFRTFDRINLVRLLFDAHILVDDADSAFTRNRNRHFGSGDRIHGRGQKRRIQPNPLHQVCRDVHVRRDHL